MTYELWIVKCEVRSHQRSFVEIRCEPAENSRESVNLAYHLHYLIWGTVGLCITLICQLEYYLIIIIIIIIIIIFIICLSWLKLIIAQKAVSHVINSRALTGEKPCINKTIHALLMHSYATLSMIVPGPQMCCRYEIAFARHRWKGEPK